MKIGIMGAHGTGKTTYAYRLAYNMKKDSEKDVYVISGVARKCPYPIHAERQRWIFHTQILLEIEAMEYHNIVICDRTLLDNLAYAKRTGFSFLVDAYLPIAIDWMKTYDKIIFLRPSRPLVDDGIRDTNPDFQRDIDSILNGWVQEYSIQNVQFEDPIDDSKWISGIFVPYDNCIYGFPYGSAKALKIDLSDASYTQNKRRK